MTGLGLIGLVTVQLLRAHGCRVLGLDFDPEKLELARQFGADVVNLAAGEDPIAAANAFSRGRGVDAVIITASTKSNEPVHQAALKCRKRGRIVLVGVTGLELSRADFFEKELSFQVSCSYGPGRYDANYEERGIDYPVGFVRWTEQRNFEAVLDMMADGRLNVKPLISHRIAIGKAASAYELVGGGAPSLGILLQYPTAEKSRARVASSVTVSLHGCAAAGTRSKTGGTVAVAVIGSGNYATAVLIPAFKAAGAQLNSGCVERRRKRECMRAVSSASSRPRPMRTASSRTRTSTPWRHDATRQPRVVDALGLLAEKHVFVEKPLALTMDELATIQEAYRASRGGEREPIVMVGFNRRFAPHVQEMKRLLSGVSSPKVLVMTVNAGAIPAQHWTQDPIVGGGRIIGEGLPFRRPSTIPDRVADKRIRGDVDRKCTGRRDEGRQVDHYAALQRWVHRNDSLSCQRPQVVSEGAAGGFRGGTDSATGQLSPAHRLRGWPAFRKMNLGARTRASGPVRRPSSRDRDGMAVADSARGARGLGR